MWRRSSASTIGNAKRLKLSLERMPTVIERTRCRLCARSFGRYPVASAAVAIRSRVSWRKLPMLFKALETVPMLTLDARATSRMVGFVRVLPYSRRFSPPGGLADFSVVP
jgi:hypothetical protein